MKIINIIYGLRDPRNDVYYYIGKSSVGVNRPLTHLIKSHSEQVNQWVNQLKNIDQSPLIDIIEEVKNIDDLPDREKYWINYYFAINSNLLNTQLVPKEIDEIRSKKTDQEFETLILIFYRIPEILQRERMLRGIKQEELSEITGLSRSTISLLERGSKVSFNSVKLYLEALLKKERSTSIKRERVRNNK